MRFARWPAAAAALMMTVLLPAGSLASVAAIPSSTCAAGTVPGYLAGVAATSSSNAWAAGYHSTGTSLQTLIEHWTGTAWRQQASPNPAGFSFGSQLAGVAATSSSSAWAVGQSVKDVGPTVAQTLIARWNGTAWAQVPSPNPGGTGSGSENLLGSVYALSSSSAWAVGRYATSPSAAGHTLVIHWNGTAWKQQPSP
ncbi:MAG: hypothetical protein J2P30_21395 [Actinobacteria bacterium]|nr:hypothetical protein [Actinomycetota bacterium]